MQKGVAGVKVIKEPKFSENKKRGSGIFCQMKETENTAGYTLLARTGTRWS